MTEEQLYRIEQFDTTGWVIVYSSLSKEECKNVYDGLMNEGISPNRIRIVREQ